MSRASARAIMQAQHLRGLSSTLQQEGAHRSKQVRPQEKRCCAALTQGCLPPAVPPLPLHSPGGARANAPSHPTSPCLHGCWLSARSACAQQEVRDACVRFHAPSCARACTVRVGGRPEAHALKHNVQICIVSATAHLPCVKHVYPAPRMDPPQHQLDPLLLSVQSGHT